MCSADIRVGQGALSHTRGEREFRTLSTTTSRQQFWWEQGTEAIAELKPLVNEWGGH